MGHRSLSMHSLKKVIDTSNHCSLSSNFAVMSRDHRPFTTVEHPCELVIKLNPGCVLVWCLSFKVGHELISQLKRYFFGLDGFEKLKRVKLVFFYL